MEYGSTVWSRAWKIGVGSTAVKSVHVGPVGQAVALSG